MAVKVALKAERQASAATRRPDRAPVPARSLPAHDLQTLAMHLSPNRHPKNVDAVLSLQRTIGNAAVRQLLRQRATANRNAADASQHDPNAIEAPFVDLFVDAHPRPPTQIKFGAADLSSSDRQHFPTVGLGEAIVAVNPYYKSTGSAFFLYARIGPSGAIPYSRSLAFRRSRLRHRLSRR